MWRRLLRDLLTPSEPVVEPLVEPQPVPLMHPAAQERIVSDGNTLDEIWLKGVDIHLEAMDRDSIWIGIYREGQDSLHVSLTSKKKIRGFAVFAGEPWPGVSEEEADDEWPQGVGTVPPRPGSD